MYVHLVPMLGNHEVQHKVKLGCLSFFLPWAQTADHPAFLRGNTAFLALPFLKEVKGLHAPACVKCTILQVHRVKIHSGM